MGGRLREWDGTMRVKKRGPAIAAITAVLTVCALVRAAVAYGGASVGPDRLEEVHGFRGGVDGRVEDDMIALWHAFDRERYVRGCMEDAGFSYSIAVVFPHESMLAVARSLGLRGDISTSSRLAAEIDILQTAEVSRLGDSDRDRYYFALLGESARDVEYVDATGMLPEGRNDFATGGCRGAAWDEIPGHYVLRADILAELREVKALESADIEACVTEDGLVIDSLGALEGAYDELLASETNHSEAEASLRACEEMLLAAEGAASERARATVFERHKTRLEVHHGEFETVFDKIESDREFLVYLDALVIDLEREFSGADALDDG